MKSIPARIAFVLLVWFAGIIFAKPLVDAFFNAHKHLIHADDSHAVYSPWRG